MDQCGFPKSAFYIRQALWIKDKPILQVIPHWNWPGRENQPIKVMAISNAEEVELFVNGKSQGRKKNDPYDMVEWPEVPYEPGKLEAIAYRDGKETTRFAVQTTGPAVALELVPDRSSMRGDGQDAQPVTVCAVDAAGNVVPDSQPMATLTVSGPGTVIGIANGDPCAMSPRRHSATRSTTGWRVPLWQSSRGGSGPLTLTATAEGLRPAKVTISVDPVSAPPMLEPAPRAFLVQRWRMSPVSATAPDPQMKINDTDMNTWTAVDAGKPQRFVGGRFAMFRANIKPPAFLKRKLEFSSSNALKEKPRSGSMENSPPPPAMIPKRAI
jgi:beta-galactosidase